MKRKVLFIFTLLLFAPFIINAEDEVESRYIENLTEWFADFASSQKSIVPDKSSKTATLYDEKNHIYRIDIKTQSNLKTFEGPVDLGFMLDVSNSMLFPSSLSLFAENFNIYKINQGGNSSLNRNETYYLIGDPSYSSTVFKIFYKDGYWYAADASKSIVEGNIFRIGIQQFKLFYNSSETLYPFSEGDNINTPYDIYVARQLNLHGEPVTRLDSLKQSIENTRFVLKNILNNSKLAKNDLFNPDVRIAYNTFAKSINNYRKEFISINDDSSINFTYDTLSGTHTDFALGLPDDEEGSPYYGINRSAATFEWNYNHINYGILFTDGIPLSSGNLIGNNRVYDAASILKTRNNVRLITVGLGLENVPTGTILLSNLADMGNNGEQLFYSAEDGLVLPNVFLQIIKDLTITPSSVGTITDVISEDFYPIDKETGEPLKVNDKVSLDGSLVDNNFAGPTGIIKFVDNKYQVQWENQIVTMDGWHGTVYIKAKDGVHGKDIPTNFGPATIVANNFLSPNNEVIELSDNYKSEVELEPPKVTIIAEKEATEEMDISASKLIKDIFPEVETVLGVDLIIRDENIVKIEDGKIIPLAIGSTDIEFIKDATKYTIHVLVTHLEADPIPAEPEQENPNTGFKYLLWILSIMIVSGTAAVLYWFKTKRLTKEVK